VIIIILLILLPITIAIIYNFFTLIYCIAYRFRINNLLENINTKEDLNCIPYKDFVNVAAEAFKRKGYKVRLTDKCGEYGNGLILNDFQFVEVWKYVSNHIVDVEVAMNLAKRMQISSIYRGMLICLGDFKQSTRLYCHKNVIECVSSEQLLEMFKEVQHKKEVLQADLFN